MGSLCCCFHVADPVENVNRSTSARRGCMCPNCFVGTLFSKHKEVLGRQERAALPADNNAAAPLSSNAASDNAQAETMVNPPPTLSFDANPRVFSLQQEHSVRMRENGAGQLHKNIEKQRGGEVNGEHKSNEHNPENPIKLSKEIMKAKDSSVYDSFEDEDVCPTCLEEYTSENPKIVIQCNHHYHLGCIYEWMERSATCPVCSKEMIFKETR